MARLLDGRSAAVVGVEPALASAIAAACTREGAVLGDAVDVLVVGRNGDRAPVAFAEADADLSAWRTAVDGGVFATLEAVRPVAERMRAAGAGSIVFVCSGLVRVPQPARGADAVADRGLLAAAQALARELGPSGVRVNTVVTGSVVDADAVADAVVFFASDLAEVVTGQSLDVNGGEVFH
jgi:NAD(P)-dependent dehydrogenase (short-subunit alcohol dehydrogenase family)